MRQIQVAAGILRKHDGTVLISERLGDGNFAGLWEFPGGKLKTGESAEVALRRELHEELGIEVGRLSHYSRLDHEYPDRAVAIDFFLVDDWAPEPTGREGQGLRWLRVADLKESTLLPADAPIVKSLRALWGQEAC